MLVTPLLAFLFHYMRLYSMIFIQAYQAFVTLASYSANVQELSKIICKMLVWIVKALAVLVLLCSWWTQDDLPRRTVVVMWIRSRLAHFSYI